MNRSILDPCCGSRMMWLDCENPDVVFGKNVKEPGITVQGAQKDWDRARAFGLALGVSEGVILSLAPDERGRAQGLLDEARSLWDKHLTTP